MFSLRKTNISENMSDSETNFTSKQNVYSVYCQRHELNKSSFNLVFFMS